MVNSKLLPFYRQPDSLTVLRLPRPDRPFTLPPGVCPLQLPVRDKGIATPPFYLSPPAAVRPMLTHSYDIFVPYHPVVTAGITPSIGPPCPHPCTPLATTIYPIPMPSPPYLPEIFPSGDVWDKQVPITRRYSEPSIIAYGSDVANNVTQAVYPQQSPSQPIGLGGSLDRLETNLFRSNHSFSNLDEVTPESDRFFNIETGRSYPRYQPPYWYHRYA